MNALPEKKTPHLQLVERQDRVPLHSVVEVRRFKWVPLFAQSAVLLDLSLSGFKVEFTGEVEAKPGRHYWIVIPLRPLGIFSPSQLYCSVECRWFDEARFRMGGVFLNLAKEDRQLIEQVISAFKSKSAL